MTSQSAGISEEQREPVIREERRDSATCGQIDVLPGCGLQEAVEGDRNRADASTGGVMDPVRDGSGDADEADLADALGSERRERIRLSDEDDVDVRSVGVDGGEVVAEGGVGDAARAGVDDVLLEHGLADAADGSADALAAGGLLVEDAAGVDGGGDACDADEAEVF